MTEETAIDVIRDQVEYVMECKREAERAQRNLKRACEWFTKEDLVALFKADGWTWREDQPKGSDYNYYEKDGRLVNIHASHHPKFLLETLELLL